MLLAVAGLLLLVSGAPVAEPTPAPRPASIVVLRDGTRYTLAKPYEIRGTQARLSLVNGSLVAIRTSEIDEEASKRAMTGSSAPPSPAPARPPLSGPKGATTNQSTAPKAIGVEVSQPESIDSLGSRVKLNRDKADTVFRQDFIPTPAPSALPTAKSAAGGKDHVAEMFAASVAAEGLWREREANRRARLATARQNQSDVCARYNAAAAAAGTRDGYVSDAAGAILGALLADCQKASREADAIDGEKAILEEECRKTQGCQPGWLR